MHIPSRVEVLSWNENQVADLLREHKLNDCVDCVFQRHIDGQKLLHLSEGDVLYFLEIHDSKSRGRFWSIVKQITEKKEKKGGGVHSLMSKFQDTSQWNNNTGEYDESDDSDDSFESDYDEPDPDPPEQERQKPAISLERKETIKKNLLMSLMSQAAAPQVNNEEDYPTSEEIYDIPEDGCGEPDEDMYDVPSDESGGGIVGRRPPPLQRKESDQYLAPDDRKLVELSQVPDEEDYEDLNGALPPMGHPQIDTQEEYVVPDMKPALVVPPRPPKSLTGKKALPPPVENGHTTGKKNKIKNLQTMFQEQENYEPPQPQRGLKKQSVTEAPKPPPKAPVKVSPQPPRVPKKIEKQKTPVIPVELDPEEMYEPPDQPVRNPKKPAAKPPVEIEQESYEAPETPIRPTKKPPVTKPPPVMKPTPPVTKPPPPVMKPPPAFSEQENYEPPELQRKNKPIPVPIMDPEENYEDPNQMGGGMNESDGEECGQEDYEIPDRQDVPPKEAAPAPSKKPHFSAKNIFRSPSKKVPNVPTKVDKKKTNKIEVPVAPPPKPIPAVPKSRPPPSMTPPARRSVLNKFRGDSKDNRSSMALPSLPTDNVDSKSDFPALPSKPSEKPVLTSRHSKPEPPPSRPPQKTKQELLEDQAWFHGLISKKEVVDILKSAKKDGAYLVRKSSRDPKKCIMSIFYKNDIRHLNIPCDEKGHYRLGDSGVERFKNIEELVAYFNKHDVEFSAGGKTPLTHACMKS